MNHVEGAHGLNDAAACERACAGWREELAEPADADVAVTRFDAWRELWRVFGIRSGWCDANTGSEHPLYEERFAATLAVCRQWGAEGDDLAEWLGCEVAELLALAECVSAAEQASARGVGVGG